MKRGQGRVAFSLLLGLMFAGLPSSSWANQEQLNFISDISGDVQVKRRNWFGYRRAYPGDGLSSEDRLRLGSDASAKVSCNNLDVWQVPAGRESQVSEGCPAARESLGDPGRSDTRSFIDPTIPYLISPRNTSIATTRPTLRWNAIEGATRYRVQIRGPRFEWTTQVEETEVVYSGEEPLRRGIRYRVFVTADSGVSTQGKDRAGFTVLDEADVREIETQVARLQQQPLGETSAILLAHLYRRYNLNAKAIELLEEAIEDGNRITATYQLLGELYEQVGLSRHARERYETALELASAQENLAGEALARESLGALHQSLGELSTAVEWFDAAREDYRGLGDEERVHELSAEIRDLQQRI